jgi:hypothetical protein
MAISADPDGPSLNRQSKNMTMQGFADRAHFTLSAEPPPHLIAHLRAEFGPARRPFLLVDIEAVEDVEIFQDRVTIAGHRQDAEQFARRPARAADFPAADHVGAVAGGKPAQPRHVGRRQAFADGVAEILAKLFQFVARHGY